VTSAFTKELSSLNLDFAAIQLL